MYFPSFLVKHVFFPVHERLKGLKTVSFLKELEKTQWLSPEEIERYKWEKLKALLSHAYHNVPYYRSLFNRMGMVPDNIRNFQDFKKIPCVSKKEMKRDLKSFLSQNTSRRDMIRMNTGGSSGEPLVFFVDRRRISYDRAAHIRARRWWGIDVGDREVVLWGSPVELSTQNLVKDLRDRLLNTKLLSAFNTSEATMVSYAKFIKKFKPRHIFGYASSIYLLCITMEKIGISFLNAGVKTVFVTAEVLYEYQKKKIEECFGCPVANGYGSREGGFVAHECPEGGMHITEDIHVECLVDGEKDAGINRRGEIVITHLDNYTMPFIRYRTADIGILTDKRCDCSRGSELMKVVEGRSTDFILTPSGKIMHGLSLIYILRDVEGIDRFKIIQKKRDFLIVQIVKNRFFTVKDQKLIVKKIKRVMEAEVNVEFQYKSIIDSDPSGKYRYVVSELFDSGVFPH